MQEAAVPVESTTVGDVLRRCRLHAGLSLADAAAGLKIRRLYLAAIEEGQLDGLPGPIYALGFVRAYAEYLGLDGEAVANRFRAETVVRHKRESRLQFPAPLSESEMPRGAVLLVGALIAILAYGTWYLTSDRPASTVEVAPVPDRLERMLSNPNPRIAHAPEMALSTLPAPAAPVPADAAPPEPHAAEPHAAEADAAALTRPSAAPVVSGSAQMARIAQAAEPPHDEAADGERARIVLRAKSDSWVEVRETQSKSVVAARMLKAGESYAVPDRPGLKLLTGNAGGLEVLVDGEASPSLGREGAVRRNILLDPDALRGGTEPAN